MRIISFGAGVQTTALAILAARGKSQRPDAVVFADTGAESPETYRHIEQFGDYLKKYNLPFIKVAAPKTLYDKCMTSQIIPSRTYRSCTDFGKIRPVRRLLRDWGADRKGIVAQVELGISTDEDERETPSEVKYAVNVHPLIELNLSRDDCSEIIREEKVPMPPKSGCWYCPFQGKASWMKLRREEPEKFEAACRLEENVRPRPGKPKYYLEGKNPIREMDRIQEFEFDYAELEGKTNCKTGYCHR